MKLQELFDSIRTIPSDPSPNSLSLFLEFMKLLEEEVYISDNMRGTTTIVHKVYNTIIDPNLCAVSGSSVLYHRLDKESKASDIDLFIDATDPKIIEVFKQFFNIKDSIFKKIIDSMDFPDRDGFSTSLQSDSAATYNSRSFTFQNNAVVPFKTHIHDSLILNIIFIHPIPGLVHRRPNWGHVDVEAVKKELKYFCENDLSYNYEIKNFKVLEYIWLNFDFQELKYFYNFQLKEAIPVIKQVIDHEKKEREKIQALIDARNKDDLKPEYRYNINRWDNYIDHLQKDNQRYKELFSDGESDVLTISSRDAWDNPYKPVFINRMILHADKPNYGLETIVGDEDEFQIPIQHLETINLYFGLLGRIHKYSKNGFKIRDPHQFIMMTQVLLTAYNYKGLTNKDIVKINRDSFLNFRSPTAPHAFKFLNAFTKGFRQLLVDLRVLKDKEVEEV